MTNRLDPTTLPKQFLPFYLGHEKCTADDAIKGKIDAVFTRKLREFGGRNYVFNGGEWVIKGERTGLPQGVVAGDVHIHRITLKEILNDFVEKKSLGRIFPYSSEISLLGCKQLDVLCHQ